MTQQPEIIEPKQLFEGDDLLEGLEALENVMPAIPAVYDEDARRELPELLEDPREAEAINTKFSLLLQILESSTTVEDMAEQVEASYQGVQEQYESNLKEVFEKTKPFERTIRSLNLLYQNSGTDPNVWVMPVSASKFADSANPKHFNAMEHELRERYYAWYMENSPFYITYVGDAGSKSAMDAIASIAEETRALAILDIKEMGSAKKIMEYADRIKIVGDSPHLAHLAVPGTWVYVQGAIEMDFVKGEDGRLQRRDRPMAVPASSALIGRLMAVSPGESITSLESQSIIGINGVRANYKYERIDAQSWDERGLIQIESYGHIQGASTANKSNNQDLRKFPKVDVANALLKDLVQFCNKKAASKWGSQQKRQLQRDIENYLNLRVKHGMIEGYEIEDIYYDPQQMTVSIKVNIKYFEVVDTFDLFLHGSKGAIDYKR